MDPGPGAGATASRGLGDPTRAVRDHRRGPEAARERLAERVKSLQRAPAARADGAGIQSTILMTRTPIREPTLIRRALEAHGLQLRIGNP
jgi:hypothetical protein